MVKHFPSWVQSCVVCHPHLALLPNVSSWHVVTHFHACNAGIARLSHHTATGCCQRWHIMHLSAAVSVRMQYVDHCMRRVLHLQLHQQLLSCRPFVFQNQLHVSYAMEIFDKSLNVTHETRSDAHKMRFQGNGFARVDLQTLELHSLINFAQPLIPRREFPCCDKNWGVWEDNNELYILYTIMPCLTIFKLDASQKSGASLVFASCLNDDTGSLVSKSVNLEMRDIRISGHPVLWSQHPLTLLVLVHHNWRNHGGSKHWAVQLQFDTRQRRFVISAISKDPVLDHEHYFLYNEAVQNVIAVGSYHLSQGNLRILYGDGDKYSAYADMETSNISWMHLNETAATEWVDGLNVALGDRVNSITYTEYESLVW